MSEPKVLKAVIGDILAPYLKGPDQPFTPQAREAKTDTATEGNPDKNTPPAPPPPPDADADKSKVNPLFSEQPPATKSEPKFTQKVFTGKDRVTKRNIRQITFFRDGLQVGSVTHYLDTDETVTEGMTKGNEYVTVRSNKDGAVMAASRLTAEGQTSVALDFSKAKSRQTLAKEVARDLLAEETGKETGKRKPDISQRRKQLADYLAKRADFNPKAQVQFTKDGNILVSRTTKTGYRVVDVAVFKEGTRMPSGKSDGAGPGETLAVYSYLLNKKGKVLTSGESANLPSAEYYGKGRMVRWHKVGVLRDDSTGMRIELQEQTRKEDRSWTKGPREELASWTSYKRPSVLSLIGDTAMNDVPVVSQALQVGNSAVKGLIGSGYMIGAAVSRAADAPEWTSSLTARAMSTWGDVGVSMPWDDRHADTDQRRREAYVNARQLMKNDERAIFDKAIEREAFQQGWRSREFKGQAGSAHKVYKQLFGDSHKSFEASVGAFGAYSFSQAPSYFMREAAITESMPAKIGLGTLGLLTGAGDAFLGGAALGLLGEGAALLKGFRFLPFLPLVAHTYTMTPFLIGAGTGVAEDAPLIARAFDDSSPESQRQAYEAVNRLLQSAVLLALTGRNVAKALKSTPRGIQVAEHSTAVAEPALNPYKVLGVEPGVSWAKVKKAFRKLAAENHPDKFENATADVKAKAAKRMSDASQAYHSLDAILNPAVAPAETGRAETGKAEAPVRRSAAAPQAPEAPRALPAAKAPAAVKAPKARTPAQAEAAPASAPKPGLSIIDGTQPLGVPRPKAPTSPLATPWVVPAGAAMATGAVPLFATLVESGVPTGVAALIAGASLLPILAMNLFRPVAQTQSTPGAGSGSMPLPPETLEYIERETSDPDKSLVGEPVIENGVVRFNIRNHMGFGYFNDVTSYYIPGKGVAQMYAPGTVPAQPAAQPKTQAPGTIDAPRNHVPVSHETALQIRDTLPRLWAVRAELGQLISLNWGREGVAALNERIKDPFNRLYELNQKTNIKDPNTFTDETLPEAQEILRQLKDAMQVMDQLKGSAVKPSAQKIPTKAPVIKHAVPDKPAPESPFKHARAKTPRGTEIIAPEVLHGKVAPPKFYEKSLKPLKAVLTRIAVNESYAANQEGRPSSFEYSFVKLGATEVLSHVRIDVVSEAAKAEVITALEDSGIQYTSGGSSTTDSLRVNGETIDVQIHIGKPKPIPADPQVDTAILATHGFPLAWDNPALWTPPTSASKVPLLKIAVLNVENVQVLWGHSPKGEPSVAVTNLVTSINKNVTDRTSKIRLVKMARALQALQESLPKSDARQRIITDTIAKAQQALNAGKGAMEADVAALWTTLSDGIVRGQPPQSQPQKFTIGDEIPIDIPKAAAPASNMRDTIPPRNERPTVPPASRDMKATLPPTG